LLLQGEKGPAGFAGMVGDAGDKVWLNYSPQVVLRLVPLAWNHTSTLKFETCFSIILNVSRIIKTINFFSQWQLQVDPVDHHLLHESNW
jgi:hypothetical protein